MVAKEVTKDTLASIRNNPNVITSEEVEYLKFKRFTLGTEQRIRIEKSSRW